MLKYARKAKREIRLAAHLVYSRERQTAAAHPDWISATVRYRGNLAHG